MLARWRWRALRPPARTVRTCTSSALHATNAPVSLPTALMWWRSRSNQIQYLQYIKQKLNFKSKEDWYTLTKDEVVKNFGGKELLAQYGTLGALIMTVCSDPAFQLEPSPTWSTALGRPSTTEIQWDAWKFDRVPTKWWRNPSNQRRFLEYLLKQLGGHSPTDLDQAYAVNRKDILNYKGAVVLLLHDNSLANMWTSVFPEYNWLRWRFHGVPSDFWQDRANQLAYLQWLRAKLGFDSRLEDLYKLYPEHFLENYGHGLFTQHGSSISSVVMACYPAHAWQPWKFQTSPRNWWTNRENQVKYFDWLRLEQLNLGPDLDKIYSISTSLLEKNYGRMMVHLYRYSVYDMAKALYPHYNFLPWRFSTVPNGWWRPQENKTRFLDWAKEQLGIRSLDQLYTVERSAIEELGGSGLLRQYNYSLSAMWQECYPHHQWLPWMFPHVAKQWWTKKENQMTFMKHIRKELGLKKMEDLYTLSTEAITSYGGGGLLAGKYASSVARLVAGIYPSHKWDAELFRKPKESAVVSAMNEVLKSPKASSPIRLTQAAYAETDAMLQLDSYFESQKIAVEYQGEGHYFDLMAYGEAESVIHKDAEKAARCGLKTIALIEVPFWWDQRIESIKEAVRYCSPGLLNPDECPDLPIGFT